MMTPSKGKWRGRIPQRPTVWPHSKVWTRDQRLKKCQRMARRKDSDAGQSRRRWVGYCSWWPQAQLEEFFRFVLHKYEDKRRLWPWQRSRGCSQRARRERAENCRKISSQSSKYIAGVFYLCNDRG